MTIGRFSDFQVERWLGFLAQEGCYLALHYDNPDVAGAYASEVFGGTYRRVLADFSSVDGRTVWNTAPAKWTGLPAVGITHIAGWDAVVNGNLLWYSALPSIARVQVGQAFTLAGNTIALSVN